MKFENTGDGRVAVTADQMAELQAIVPQVVQAPTDEEISIAWDLMYPSDKNSRHNALIFARAMLDKQVAAPIAATVPSEPPPSYLHTYFSDDCGDGVDFVHPVYGSGVFFTENCRHTPHENQPCAAPSTAATVSQSLTVGTAAEQASDVLSESALRAALLTAWDDGYRSPSTYNDVDANTDADIADMRKNDIDHLLSFIKSATPADKGNAPAGASDQRSIGGNHA